MSGPSRTDWGGVFWLLVILGFLVAFGFGINSDSRKGRFADQCRREGLRVEWIDNQAWCFRGDQQVRHS